MSELSKFHSHDCEQLHVCLMRFHGAIAWRAGKQIKSALEVLHRLERECMGDDRTVVRRRILRFEALRDKVEALWSSASDLRLELVREDGCDGKCKGEAAE